MAREVWIRFRALPIERKAFKRKAKEKGVSMSELLRDFMKSQIRESSLEREVEEEGDR